MSNTKTIVVIDDEAHIRRVVEMKMKNAGYRVVTAADGEEGLSLIRAELPDAVISDIMIPKLDGRTLCETVDPMKCERTFLTIIMTARISPQERSWISTMRDTVFVEKPFSPAKLLDIVNSYFEASHV